MVDHHGVLESGFGRELLYLGRLFPRRFRIVIEGLLLRLAAQLGSRPGGAEGRRQGKRDEKGGRPESFIRPHLPPSSARRALTRRSAGNTAWRRPAVSRACTAPPGA